jgi:hypothetical protein
MEPAWLVWARELQAIAQTGLTFATNTFDRERYTAIRALAARMMVTYSGANFIRVERGGRLFDMAQLPLSPRVFEETS